MRYTEDQYNAIHVLGPDPTYTDAMQHVAALAPGFFGLTDAAKDCVIGHVMGRVESYRECGAEWAPWYEACHKGARDALEEGAVSDAWYDATSVESLMDALEPLVPSAYGWTSE